MPDAMLIDAVRTPIGRRHGALSGVHPADLLAHVQKALIERSGVDPESVGQVLGGCVGQVGEQSSNLTRTAWLTAGLPQSVAATSLDSQCGSSQQAVALAAGLVAAGNVEIAIGCGVESMSRIPIGAAYSDGVSLGMPMPPEYEKHYEVTTQFDASERIATKWSVSRADCDELGLRSQRCAAEAVRDGRFRSQIVPLEVVGENGQSHIVDSDECLRETTLEGLAKLKPVAGHSGVHTAGSASQISDGAAAVLVASREYAERAGLQPRARIVDSCLVGSDPELMLAGPIDATRFLLERNDLSLDAVDVIEINEAFASVVIAWQREFDPDPEKVNPNGGAIALGHPLGASGAVLIAKALAELERCDGSLALVTMCCGGGMATGALISRDI